ncbi:hypothetical protein CC86DRAFT_366203 [Ophiobolus disseminans]|uniref:Uncharacterized protein n=1 Tax=Ophiobolus disseminans TaxID=1469910 RepID=A0A6A7AGK0_9PLEO|nr:hypothetical protein CC86DRAFT_366203 [Ophiobolus disseminans]
MPKLRIQQSGTAALSSDRMCLRPTLSGPSRIPCHRREHHRPQRSRLRQATWYVNLRQRFPGKGKKVQEYQR